MQKHSQSLITSWCALSLSCWSTAGPGDALLFFSKCSTSIFSLVVSGSVLIICRWQLKGTLLLAPCVYKRLCFLLSGTYKWRVVIPCQGEVGSNAFPQAIAETGIIYCCQRAFRISSHLQPVNASPVEVFIPHHHRRNLIHYAVVVSALGKAGCCKDTAETISNFWVVIHEVFKALKGLPWRDVIPVIWKAKDPVMFHLPVPYWQGI